MSKLLETFILEFVSKHKFCTTKIIHTHFYQETSAQNVKRSLNRLLDADEIILLGRNGRTDFYGNVNADVGMNYALHHEFAMLQPGADKIPGSFVTIFAGSEVTPEVFLQAITSRTPQMFNDRFDWKTRIEPAIVKLITHRRSGFTQTEIDDAWTLMNEWAIQMKATYEMVSRFARNQAVYNGAAAQSLSNETINYWSSNASRRDDEE